MVWNSTKNALKKCMVESLYSLWVAPLEFVCENENELTLACPDRFYRAHLERTHLSLIQQTLDEISGGTCSIKLCDKTVAQLPGTERKQLRLPHMPVRKSIVRSLHPRYTFDAFMVGESNLLAQSACRSMALGDSKIGSCLYINSATGLGKSHLTHAVAHTLLEEAPQTRIRYVTAQQFASEMVRGIRTGAMDQFKSGYHDQCDFLLVEDVHALKGKKKTQEELNEVLDALIKSGKRVILTANNSPRDLQGIDSEFKSRMGSGLVTTIQAPDPVTRYRIVESKALINGIDLDEEAVSYISQHIQGDVRRIESALLTLRARASLSNGRVNMETVQQVVTEIAGVPKDLNTELIGELISREFNVSCQELRSRSRKKGIAFPRQIAMYLGRKHTKESLGDIGRTFNRNHATVLHSVKVISELCRSDISVKRQIEILDRKTRELQ